jgi:ribosomal protein S18 acetylase RimI-like enzyme
VLTASARPATTADIPDLGALYAELEAEMVALKPVWRLTDGLAQPVETEFGTAIARSDAGVLIGAIDEVSVGFLLWRVVPLLLEDDGSLAVIELVFTKPEARQVGVGEAMLAGFVAEASSRNVDLFDAVVPPGHRAAKNFFESHGFKARRIVMHRGDR